MSFRQALESGKFLVTAEVGPGKGIRATAAQHMSERGFIRKRNRLSFLKWEAMTA